MESFQSTSNENGKFLSANIPLKNRDKVSIKVPGSPSYSSELASTIPFKEITLLSADYFSETATLMVAASKSEWAQMAGSPGAGRNVSAISARPTLPGSGGPAQANIANPGSVIDRITNFRNQLVWYNGPVTFWVRDDINQRPRREDALHGTIVLTPMGISKVTGLNFKPGQWVRASIELEGFIIQSEWVPSEGLMISAIEHDNLNFSSNLATMNERYSSNNSFVVISAIDGNTTPTGTLTMLRGFDSPHSSPSTVVNVSDFPDAHSAVVWFQKNTTLTPVPRHPGVAIASSGSWETNIRYQNRNFLLPAKNGKHHFEKVSYTFKGKNLGYQYFNKECHSCKSPVNLIESMLRNKQNMEAIRNNPGTAPAPQVPPVNPLNNRNLGPVPQR